MFVLVQNLIVLGNLIFFFFFFFDNLINCFNILEGRKRKLNLCKKNMVWLCQRKSLTDLCVLHYATMSVELYIVFNDTGTLLR